ncbi:MAG: hypothetical protein P1U42_04975 [Phycisphaerales bacterium]|nr:hypothetical protein [Phycisphaerales bacterium]
MPKSHICPTCLVELARIRAVPDPHYGLPVVVCPGCNAACVRTKHPDREFWRQYLRTNIAIRLVIGKFAMTLIMGLILWGFVVWAEDIFVDFRGNLHLVESFTALDINTALGSWGIVLFSFIMGYSIRIMYAHHRFWVPLVILVSVGAFFGTIDYSTSKLVELIALVGNFETTTDNITVNALLIRGKLLMLILIPILLGFLAVRVLSGSMRKSQSNKFRRVLKKQRKRRAYEK